MMPARSFWAEMGSRVGGCDNNVKPDSVLPCARANTIKKKETR